MCVEVDDSFKVKLNFNQSQRVSSNNYPKHYPVTDNGYYESCIRRFYADRGAFMITFLDTRISLGDNIGIGMGLTPRFASTVYGSSAAAKSPSRGNHPRSVYVLPIPLLGSNMWIAFGTQSYLFDAQDLHQFTTVTVGFLLEIQVVEETAIGMSKTRLW